MKKKHNIYEPRFLHDTGTPLEEMMVHISFVSNIHVYVYVTFSQHFPEMGAI